jgi:nuclease A inhibitor-like protein
MDDSSPKPPIEVVDAIAGLTYPSDSDEPWEAFVWPGSKSINTPRQALAQHVDPKRIVVEVPIEKFFSQLRDGDDAQRYDRLSQTVTQILRAAAVFRVGDGEVSVDVYLIGGFADGQCAGIKTTSIET